MSDFETEIEPEWDSPVVLEVTPRAIIECVFWNADAVHTGYESCIEPKLVIVDTIAHDDNSDNYCRYVEQEYMEEETTEETTWHDWTVELKLGEVFVVAHWRVLVGGSPADWGLVRAGVGEGVFRRIDSREQAGSQVHRRRHFVLRTSAATDPSLARLRPRPTKHARRPFLARASRAPPTRRSLEPSCREPLSEIGSTVRIDAAQDI